MNYKSCEEMERAIKAEKQSTTNHIIGKLIAYEKYRFIDGRLIAEIVRDTTKIIIEGE